MVVFNTSTQSIIDNVKAASRRNIPWLSQDMCNFSGECAIVAGGESLKNYIEEIRNLPKDTMIFSCNGTHDYLVERGIRPDFFTMLDARALNDFAKTPQKDCIYMLASQVHKKMFERLKDYQLILWHTEHEAFPKKYVEQRALQRKQGQYFTIAGKGSIGLTTICLAHTMGFRSFRLYGYDSSFSEYQHAYKQTQNEKDKILHHELNGVIYKTTPNLMAQIGTYLNLLPLLEDCKVAVRSDGLIKAIQESYESSRRSESDNK
jgi:hypothetical protein